MDKFLNETELLDYKSEQIQHVISEYKFNELDLFQKINSIYSFVRDDVKFGFNFEDEMKASMILKDAYGQCNTKSILFMALLRACKIPCRIHAFMIKKEVQKGLLNGLYYKVSPDEILHTWVEVFYKEHWCNLEGIIIDKEYLSKLQTKFASHKGKFIGYGIAVNDFQNPPIDFCGGDTYIQKESISKDLGVFDSPDDLLKKYTQKLGKTKKFLYANMVRHFMNINVKKIRKGNEKSQISK